MTIILFFPSSSTSNQRYHAPRNTALQQTKAATVMLSSTETLECFCSSQHTKLAVLSLQYFISFTMMAMPITVCNYHLSCQFGSAKKCQKESPALVIEFWSPLFTNNVACAVPIVCEFDAFANDLPTVQGQYQRPYPSASS